MKAPKTFKHDGKSYIEDDIIAALPLGNVPNFGRFLAKDREEAKMLVGEFLVALNSGQPITPREYGFAVWLLRPVLEGKDPNLLPFKKNRGRPAKARESIRETTTALKVHRKRRKLTLNEAIYAVAIEMKSSEDSVRGIYERSSKPGLNALDKSSKRLAAYVRKVGHHKK